MTDDDGVRVTNREVYNALLDFRKEFSEYVKDQGPKMVLLEYKVNELENKLDLTEKRTFDEKQTRKLFLWGFAGSSVMLEVLNWILFHK